jgi:kynurenine aminotransferase
VRPLSLPSQSLYAYADGRLAAIGLEQASSQNFFPTQIAEYAERRALLTGMLDNLGIKYTQPHGSYFVLADFARLRIPEDFELPEEIKRRPRDFHMAWFVAKTCNVVT